MSTTETVNEAESEWHAYPDWDKVSRGCKQIRTGIMLVLAVFFSSFIWLPLNVGAVDGNTARIALVTPKAIVFLVGTFFVFAGLKRLSAGPGGSRSSGLFQGAMAAAVVCLVGTPYVGYNAYEMVSAVGLDNATMLGGRANQWFITATVLSGVSLAGFVGLIMGIGRLGRYMKREDISASARDFILFFLAVHIGGAVSNYYLGPISALVDGALKATVAAFLLSLLSMTARAIGDRAQESSTA